MISAKKWKSCSFPHVILDIKWVGLSTLYRLVEKVMSGLAHAWGFKQQACILCSKLPVITCHWPPYESIFNYLIRLVVPVKFNICMMTYFDVDAVRPIIPLWLVKRNVADSPVNGCHSAITIIIDTLLWIWDIWPSFSGRSGWSPNVNIRDHKHSLQ